MTWKSIGVVEVQLHAFLTSALGGDELSDSSSEHFNHWHPLERRLGGHQSWSGTGGEEKKSHHWPCWEMKPGCLTRVNWSTSYLSNSKQKILLNLWSFQTLCSGKITETQCITPYCFPLWTKTRISRVQYEWKDTKFDHKKLFQFQLKANATQQGHIAIQYFIVSFGGKASLKNSAQSVSTAYIYTYHLGPYYFLT